MHSPRCTEPRHTLGRSLTHFRTFSTQKEALWPSAAAGLLPLPASAHHLPSRCLTPQDVAVRLASAGWHSPQFIRAVALCTRHISSIGADVTSCFCSLATALNTRAHGNSMSPCGPTATLQVGGSPSRVLMCVSYCLRCSWLAGQCPWPNPQQQHVHPSHQAGVEAAWCPRTPPRL